MPARHFPLPTTPPVLKKAGCSIRSVPSSNSGGFSDVLCKIKAGKEASVYLCRSGDQVKSDLVAAKVFRPRRLRNLKNDQLYRQGRAISG